MSHKTRILHIEKDSSTRLLLKLALLARWDGEFELLQAADGLSGIVQMRRELPDIIVLDLLLPDMNGYEVVAVLRNFPALADKPVVALTADSDPDARALALAAGCDGYIEKPINMNTLALELHEYSRGKREHLSPREERRFLREHVSRFALRIEDKFAELDRARSELQESERLSSKFIALAAHELRTPVTIIQGYLGILLDAAWEGRSIDGPESKSVTSGLDKGVQRLSNIINDLLDAARIESGGLQLHLSEGSIGEIVRSVASDLRPVLETREQELAVEPLDGLPGLWLDSRRMHQAVTNVLGNAIKYTPDGGRICVSGSVVSPGDVPSHPEFKPVKADYVDISVHDTGIGISAEDAERIFKSFYEVRDGSLHSTSKYQFLGGGIGLGLAIARGIMKKHGGWLWVESPGCDLDACPGSRFHLLIPVRMSHSILR